MTGAATERSVDGGPAAVPAPPSPDRWSRVVRLAPHAGVVVAVIAVVMQPMIATAREYGQDWGNHLWVMWVQGAAWSTDHAPSLFLNADPLGAFYPHFAFYGGTLYAVGGLVSAVLGGSAVVAYLLMWLLGVGMAYGALAWMGWQAGLRDWRIHVAPTVYLTAAYVISNLYVRGSLPEVIATSAFLLVLAAGVDLLRSERVRPLAAVIYAGAVVLYTGSHNITLFVGTVVTLLFALVAFWAVGGPRGVDRRRVLLLVGLGVLAALVNAWFLFPDAAFSGQTSIGDKPQIYDSVANGLGRMKVLFALKRTGPEVTGSLYTQLPTIVLVWLLLSAAAIVRHEARPWRRMAAGSTAILVVFVVFMVSRQVWNWIPDVFSYIQFPFRLLTYALFAIALLTIAALRSAAVGPWPRLRLAVLVVGLGVGVYATILQGWTAPLAGIDRNQPFAHGRFQVPATWADRGNYRDSTFPQIAPDRVTGELLFPPGLIRHGRITMPIPPRSGDLIRTNLAADEGLVHVIGATRVGRTPGNFETDGTAGFAILKPDPGATSITLRENRGGWVGAGAIVSLLSIAALVLLLAAALVRGRRQGARGSTGAAGTG